MNHKPYISRFCLNCSMEILPSWKDWPLRSPIPVPPIVEDAGCEKCGKAEVLLSSDIAWRNYHSPENTGLPDYWYLLFETEKLFIPSWQEKWGFPYFRKGECGSCGSVSFTSMFYEDKPRYKTQCNNCGFINLNYKN